MCIRDRSREETTSVREGRDVEAIEASLTSPALEAWLKSPNEDWALATDILRDIQSVVNKSLLS